MFFTSIQKVVYALYPPSNQCEVFLGQNYLLIATAAAAANHFTLVEGIT